MDRIDVKTLAEAEAAIANGQAINIIGGAFVLTISSGHANIAVAPGVSASVVARGSSSVVAWDFACVVARESASVEAWESASVVAWETARVVARESASVVARGSARVVARGSARVEAWDSARVEARGSARVEAWDSARVEAWDSARVEAWGSARVEAWDSARVEAWDFACVEAWGSARVVAWDSARVVAWDSARVVAHGYCFIDHRSDVPARASAHVSVNLWHGATCEGGRQQVVSFATAQDWCEYYGARIEDGHAIVYKAVGEGYRSKHGVTYEPGSMPSDPAWNGKGRECAKGGGLNFSPTPRHTHKFVTSPAHYLECRIALEEMVVHFDGSYPEKCCAPRVVAPLVEVDVDGVPVAVTEGAV